ncbi:winged helix-turn-helix domain-containing protein [Thermoproteota archaeon]
MLWRCVITKKKNEVKVVAEILRVAAKGSDEGEIMDRCKLDTMSVENYLSALAKLSMLTIDDENEEQYRTTKKGLEFLNTYHRLRWLLLGKDNDFLLMRLLEQIKTKEQNPFYVS